MKKGTMSEQDDRTVGTVGTTGDAGGAVPAGAGTPGAGPAELDAVMDRLTAKVAGLMNIGVSEIDPEEELMDQGLDSVRLVEVVSFLREQGYRADFADLAEDSSLSAWRELLEDLGEDLGD